MIASDCGQQLLDIDVFANLRRSVEGAVARGQAVDFEQETGVEPVGDDAAATGEAVFTIRIRNRT